MGIGMTDHCSFIINEHEDESGFVQLQLAGSLYRQEVSRLWESAAGLLLRGIPWIVLDLRQIEFICSAGFGLMVRLAQRCSVDKGALVLLGPSRAAIADTLETTKIANVVPVLNSVEQAREYLLANC